MTADVHASLARLQSAAQQARTGFPTVSWKPVSGSGADGVKLHGDGSFHGLVVEPGRDITLAAELDVPTESLGVPLPGEPLEATLFSIYPMQIEFNGKPVFSEGMAPVAAGPALFTIVPELAHGANGQVEVAIKVPSNQTTSWINLRLTTPGLRARSEMLDVAWAQLALADALADSAGERDAVDRAAALVPESLAPADSAELREKLLSVAEALSALEGATRRVKVHLIGHSHIDMNWLWTWPDTEEVIKRDFRNVLALMEEYPELTFSHSQPATYEVIRAQTPELFEQVKRYIAAGRWEPITMTWVEGDVNMASGEALARQLLEGVHYSRDELGATPAVLHAPDTFGHAGNLPQLAASAGATCYYHHRCNPGGNEQWPAYWWEGQDGTRLLAISTYSYNGDITARDLANAAIRAHRYGHPVALHFHGIGDHGGGPSRQNLEALRRFQTTPLLPPAGCSTLKAYADELLRSPVALPTSRGESRTVFEGCYTTHADTKRFNRAGENLLCTADTLAAVAGPDQIADLAPPWRRVLFNQFHDILDGSAIHESYAQNAADFEYVRDVALSATEAALARLHAGTEVGRIAVTNPLGFSRSDWTVVEGVAGDTEVWLVSDDDTAVPGQHVPEGLGFVASVPAFDTTVYQLTDKRPSSCAVLAPLQPVPARGPSDAELLEGADAQDPRYLRIDTDFFRAYVRCDCGVVVSLHDKRVGRDLVGFGMRRGSDYPDTARPDLALNVFQLVEEHHHPMSAWHYDEVHSEISLLQGGHTSVAEAGPLRCVLETRHTFRSSTLVARTIFYRSLARIDFEIDLDWEEIGSAQSGVANLKAAFTARLDECEAWFETPFAAVRRPSDGQEVPALRWADVGGDTYGFAILNDSKYGCDALGCRLRLTLVRSGYDPDAISDAGHHTVRYSLMPHVGNWRDAGVARAAAGFNQPLIGRVVRSAGDPIQAFRPTLTAGASSVQIACLKHARTGSGRVVRMYETAGRAAEVVLQGIPRGAGVYEISIVEDRIRALAAPEGVVQLAFGPWQVRSILIET